MSIKDGKVSRRDFLKLSGVSAAAVGIFAFSPGLTETIEAMSPGTARITRTYSRLKVARLTDLTEGEPTDFDYPLEEHKNFLVKLGAPAQGGIGPGQDVVAFNYLCSHLGCPLNGTYRHEFTMLGPCPCHYTRFDLSKRGIMVLGQATQSLPQIMLEALGDDIYAIGVTGLVYGFIDNLEGGSPINP